MAIDDWSLLHCKPEDKDFKRAVELDEGALRTCGNADHMSKLITDPAKMLRRAKAIGLVWGTDSYAFRTFIYQLQKRFLMSPRQKDIFVNGIKLMEAEA